MIRPVNEDAALRRELADLREMVERLEHQASPGVYQRPYPLQRQVLAGGEADCVRVDSFDPTYRLWVGDFASAEAAFRVKGTGMAECYGAEYQWARLIATYLALPGLVGLWPMSVFDASGNAQDVSGHGHHLTYNGDPTYGYDGFVPYIELDGDGDFLSWADCADNSIVGTEAHVESAARGLTVGSWAYCTDDTNQNLVLTKAEYNTNISWELSRQNNFDWVRWMVSDDGGYSNVATKDLGTWEVDKWHLVMGRFDPGSHVAVTLDGTHDTTSTSIADIYDSTAPFLIGRNALGWYEFHGRVSLAFMCQCYLSDAICTAIWNQGRGLFGRFPT